MTKSLRAYKLLKVDNTSTIWCCRKSYKKGWRVNVHPKRVTTKTKLSEEKDKKKRLKKLHRKYFYEQFENTYKLWNQKNCNLQAPTNTLFQNFQSCWLLLILLSKIGTGFSNTDTWTLFQTSDKVGSVAIFSATSMSSGRTEPKTVYSCFHSEWSAKLIKNSGPEPIKATEPLLKMGQSSMGSLLNGVPCASNVPWINANGGPKPACKIIGLIYYYHPTLQNTNNEKEKSVNISLFSND